MNLPSERRSLVPVIAGLVGGAFALIGVLRMPYGYYSVMRFVIAAACAVLAVAAVSRCRPLATAPLIFVALFMLLVKGLPKDAWQVIDLGVAVLLIGMGAWLSSLELRE
jgi:hypothetical protein